MFLSVILPCYNTRDCIEPLYERLIKTLSSLNSEFELIFIDDGSPQNDWEVIRDLAHKDRRVKLVKLLRNFNQQRAISAGLTYSQGDWIVIMDADLQDRPEEIPRLLEKALEGHNIVFAKRKQRKDSLLKKIYSKLFHKIFVFLSGIDSDNSIANFGVYNRQVIDAFLSMKEHFRGFRMLLAWMGFKYATIDVEHQERTIGKTSYNIRKGLFLALNAFITFSDKPLKITALSGLVLSLVSMFIGIIYFTRGLLGYTNIVGWTSLIISIWFLSGINILIMGMIGLYLGKVFEETKRRPHFLVEFTENLDL